MNKQEGKITNRDKLFLKQHIYERIISSSVFPNAEGEGSVYGEEMKKAANIIYNDIINSLND